MINITIGYPTIIIRNDKYVTNVCAYIFIIYGMYCRRFDGGAIEDMLWLRDSDRFSGCYAFILKVRLDVPSLYLFGREKGAA